jgi:hypothetical protein
MGLGYVIDRAAREPTRSDWSPGDETDAVLLAIIQHVFAAAIDEIVTVLNSRHFEQLQGCAWRASLLNDGRKSATERNGPRRLVLRPFHGKWCAGFCGLRSSPKRIAATPHNKTIAP